MSGFEGLRVVVVEDEPLLLLELQDILAEMGAVVVGSAGHLNDAIELARDAEFDIAVLDVNLGPQRSDRVAEVIAARGIRLVFASGYGASAIPAAIKGEMVEKPYEAAALQAAIVRTLAAVPRASGPAAAGPK